MKRLTTILLTLAICVGVFAPVAIAFSGRGMTTGSVEVSVAHAQTATSTPITTAGGTTNTSAAIQLAVDPTSQIADCTNLTKFINPGACIAWLVYYIPYDLGEWFMSEAARAFDIAASFTLSSKLYTSGSFLQQGWQVTRDFANIFFILILLFIALSLVLDIEIGHANPKKMLATLVMVALVINFSFFITEVVIDISNSLALVFYNQVTVVAQVNGATVNLTDDALNKQLQAAKGVDSQGHAVQYIQTEKPLSIALVQAMKPQVLSDASFYNKLCTDSFYAAPATSGNAVKCDPNKANNSGTLIALFLLVGIMYIIVGYCFIVALGSLFGRMVSLFIAIVFAPLAFISLIVPNMAHMPGFGWDEWFSGLMKNAFAAPIFFFFILLISILSKSSIIPDTPGLATLSAGVILLLVTVQFLILITMLLAAVKYVKEGSGAIGNALGGLAGTLVKGIGGLAVGTAAGTVAIAGSRVVGGAATRLARSDKFTKWATSEDKGFAGGLKRFAGEKAIKLGQAGSKASFDIRQNGAANAFSSATGMNLGSFGALSTKRTAGGLEGAIAYKAKKDQDFAESLSKNAKQEDTLKALKGAREAAVEELERKESVLQASRDAAAAELDAQKSIRKEALETMNNLKDQSIGATDPRYKAAQDKFDAAEAAMEGKKKTADDARTAVTDLKKEILEKKTGTRNTNGEQIKLATIGALKADGTAATAQDITNGVVMADSLSMKDIDNLIESNKKANAKAYLYAQARDTGYHTSAKYDKVGNVKSFHIDTTQKDDRQFGAVGARLMGQMLLDGGVASAIGLALAGPIGMAIGAGFGGLSGFVKEADTGRSFKDAEAAHHTAEPHEGGHGAHDSHGGYHPPSGGILAELTKLFGAAASGGGGGGGHGGGGGGHH